MKQQIEEAAKACKIIRGITIPEDHPNIKAYDDDYIKRNYPKEFEFVMSALSLPSKDINSLREEFEKFWTYNIGNDNLIADDIWTIFEPYLQSKVNTELPTEQLIHETGGKITFHEEMLCDFVKWRPKYYTDILKTGIHFTDKDGLISSDIMVADEFLKQWTPKFNFQPKETTEAVEFAEWILKNEFIKQTNGETSWFGKRRTEEQFTPKELYQEYLKTK